ncbi:transmembrane protein 168-like [Arapaima gigas]
MIGDEDSARHRVAEGCLCEQSPVRSLRYVVSHALYAAMARLEELNREVSMRSSLRCLGFLSNLSLLVAVCLHLYVRWEKTAEAIILVVFILGLLVLGIASILYYYFTMETASASLLHLWFGFLLGLLCFLRGPTQAKDVKEQAAGYLLLASVLIRALWALAERICGCVRFRPALLTSAEFLELVGFSVASTSLLLQQSLTITLLAVALAALIANLRMKTFFALPNLACFTGVACLLFASLDISPNQLGLACCLGRLICEPLLDAYFSGLSVTERWLPFLSCGRLWRRLSVLPLTLVEVAFLVLSAFKLAQLEQWYLVIPAWVASGAFWLVCHVVFVVTLWGFHTKLNDCQRVLSTQRCESRSLDRVMASRGMRHFCLISSRLLFFSLLSTAILGAVSWQSTYGAFMSTFLIVLALESLAHSLFHELGSCLGGTCLGYAVVIPTNYCSIDGQPTLLPPDLVQEMNLRTTGMLSSIQRFFSHHMIETYGCDYSAGGIAAETLQAKLRGFLEQRTADGPRHDTYIIYYSGHSLRSGDWALAGGDTLRLDQLLDWWKEKNGGFCSRLIVVLDSENAGPWVRDVRKVEELFVAVQGAELLRTADVEGSTAPQLGDFTTQWVEYNCNPNSDTCWSERERGVTATYGVSKRWSDYTLHLPTGSDVAKHWKAHFPQATYPLVYLANWCGGLDLLWVCGAWLRCFRRLKLSWFPPAVLDTDIGVALPDSVTCSSEAVCKVVCRPVLDGGRRCESWVQHRGGGRSVTLTVEHKRDPWSSSQGEAALPSLNSTSTGDQTWTAKTGDLRAAHVQPTAGEPANEGQLNALRCVTRWGGRGPRTWPEQQCPERHRRAASSAGPVCVHTFRTRRTVAKQMRRPGWFVAVSPEM